LANWVSQFLKIHAALFEDKPVTCPEAYTEEEIKSLLETAAGTFSGLERKKGEKHDDRLLLNAFLNSGLRDGELSHLTYGDIDTKHSIWKVRAKEEHELKTTDSKRDVPVGEWLTAKIVERKKTDGRQMNVR
jgi:integrase